MKIRKLLYAISMVLLMTSCAPTSFYQLYNVKPITESITNTDEIIFEDENCKVSYNLWANGGNIDFNFYNKTNSNIYVKLNESYFILNGFAYDYFKNRTFTTSESKSASTLNTSNVSAAITGINIYNNLQTNQVKSSSSANLSSSVGYAVSIKEDSIICIPPNTTKKISEYSINNTLVRSCDLLKYPRAKDIKTKTYTLKDSPIVFSNRISYEINGNSKLVENKFFVSEITNYPESSFFELKYQEFCGEKSYQPIKTYKFYNSHSFFIEYNKKHYYWKH
ncbi:MAG: hypothetical protein L3J56_04385 [Bacteroidales bacterium]|nr:hypothetical protein [Bacteroidales bacterium]